MKPLSISHLADDVLVRRLREAVARDRASTAEMLQLIAEVDARRLYAATRHDSMYAWCLGELGMSEDMAAKRIQVARAARRVPEVFAMIADGRLTLSAAGLLAPHAERREFGELLVAAAGRTNDQVRELLAERFPRPDLPGRVFSIAPVVLAPPEPAPACETGAQHAVRHVDPDQTPAGATPVAVPRAAGQVPEGVAPPACASGDGRHEGKQPASPLPVEFQPRVTVLAPGRYAYQFTLERSGHEKVARAKALLGHAVPSGDLAEVFERALEALVEKLEKRRFGAGRKPRETRQGPARRAKRTLVPNERYVPDRVKNAVWDRDGGRCTFVDASGRRCESRTRLEFDHGTPLARGGLSTAGNLRLRCRTHNQYEARRVLGAAFVEGKLEKAREAPASLEGPSRTAEDAGPDVAPSP
jgi:hypothetical protein